MKTQNHFHITRRGKLIIRLLPALALLLAGASVSHAVQCVQSGNWSNPATWGGAVPSGSAELIDCTVFLDTPVTVANLTLSGSGNGGTLANFGGNSITVTNRLEINTRGEIGGGQNLPLAVVIPATGTLVFSGPTPFRKHIAGSVTINNAGRIEWSGGPVYFDGVLNNSGVFAILGDAGFGSANRSGVINNTGRIVKESGAGTTQFSGFTPETNSIATWIHNTGNGVVEVASGTIEMGRGTSNGEFKIAAAKTLLISDGHTFDEAIFTGAGTCSLKGTMTFLGHINSTANLELVAGGGITAGDMTHPDAFLEGSGQLTWKGGRITGTFIVTEQVRTVLTGPDAKFYDGPVTNQGTMDWFGPGPLASDSSTLRNEGTFNVLAAGTFLADTGTSRPTFENIGTLNTFPDGTSVTSDTLILNSGLVNIGGFGHAGILQANSFEQTVTGTLQMEIGGANAATPQFDQLTGSSTINGNLTVDVINDYTPPANARFVLMNSRTGQFFRVFTPGGTARSQIEYPGQRCELVSLSDGPITPLLWGAGRDLARNESPDRAAEAEPINQTVPEWRYGYRTTATGTALTPFTPQQHVNDASGLHGWIAAGQATLGVNTKGNAIVFNSGSGNNKPLMPAQIYMSPGSGNEFLVARWTAPASGDYRITARWVDLDNHGGNGATAHLVRNGQEEFVQSFEFSATSSGRARLRARTFSLNAGDVLDFVVGSNGEYLFDATAFNAAVRRVPKVTITSPASGTELTGPQDVTFGVNVEHLVPGSKVTLMVDDVENAASDSAAPYSLTARLKPGYHKITAVATDAQNAKAESPEIVVLVTPATAPRGAGTNELTGTGSGQSPAQTPTGKLFRSTQSGLWNDPATWGNQGGVPLRWDYAIIQSGHDVVLDVPIQVRDLTLKGRLGGDNSATHQQLDVYGTLYLDGQIDNLDLFIQGPAGKLLCLRNGAVLRFVNIINQSKFVITADVFDGEDLVIENRGSIKAGPRLTSQGPLTVPVGGFTQYGGSTRLDANTVLQAPPGTVTIQNGELHLSVGQLIGNDGSTLIGNDGGTLVGDNGSTLIGNDGGTLVGDNGSTLIGNDGGTLLGPDGAPLIGNDGSTLIGNDGGTIRHSGTDFPTAPSGDGILLTGGTITGIGELRGPVVNQGAFIVPGHSAGGIVINGDYTQQSGGTLVLEIGGSTTYPFSYDIFEAAGTANLGGNLVVKTINGYTPGSGNAVSSLRYGSHTGNFATVTSNAQITLGATGGQVSVTGTNPLAPKALNIATRMRVETGDNVLIAGFIITGSQPKRVIVRGIGPSLPFAGVLADPTLNLDNGTVINDNWRTTQEQEIIGTGLPPSHNQECAIVATLSPGPHTAILGGSGGTTGIGIVEVYDLEAGSPVQLANISSRGFVQTGDNVMIGGFIIAGTYPTTMIVRAIGPSLPLAGKLEDPTLELVDQNGGRISNDNWRETQEAEIMATIPPTNDNEAAIIATLAPGNYTAIVRGQDDTTGIAVVEAYNLQ